MNNIKKFILAIYRFIDAYQIYLMKPYIYLKLSILDAIKFDFNKLINF